MNAYIILAIIYYILTSVLCFHGFNRYILKKDDYINGEYVMLNFFLCLVWPVGIIIAFIYFLEDMEIIFENISNYYNESYKNEIKRKEFEERIIREKNKIINDLEKEIEEYKNSIYSG